MRIELVTIGDELLHGKTVNTNAATIGARLVDAGFEPAAQSTVPDEPRSLEAHLRATLERADVLVTSGGLGPTVDDNTRDVLARIFGTRRWRTDKRVVAHLEKRYRRKPWRPVLDQARVPVGTTVIPNKVGTAPGLIFKAKDRALGLAGSKAAIALPGPPRELIPMLDRVVEFLAAFRPGTGAFVSLTLRTAGIRESVLDAQLREVFPKIAGVAYGLAAQPFLVDVRLFGRRRTAQAAQRAVHQAERKLRSHFGHSIYAAGGVSLEQVVGGLLVGRKQTVACAESCTGGLLGHMLTEVPGSSSYFRGSVVAYSNEWKQQFLDVPSATLDNHGAVSRETALTMSVNVRRIGNADYGVAITGIAGPSGGTKAKPVGLVYIAISDADGAECWEYNFPGERDTVRTLSARAALNHLRLALLDVLRTTTDKTASD
jgi:nicotinamide-nucleotide amidase